MEMKEVTKDDTLPDGEFLPLAKVTSIYDSKDRCAVCGSTLEDVFYADIDSFDGRTSWLDDIKVGASESKELKRCSRCGLLYAR